MDKYAIKHAIPLDAILDIINTDSIVDNSTHLLHITSSLNLNEKYANELIDFLLENNYIEPRDKGSKMYKLKRKGFHVITYNTFHDQSRELKANRRFRMVVTWSTLVAALSTLASFLISLFDK
ncbi:MAG: hypothetical protein NXI10_12305 [bacterium]|nr:hypothetical protein [bacterium]